MKKKKLSKIIIKSIKKYKESISLSKLSVSKSVDNEIASTSNDNLFTETDDVTRLKIRNLVNRLLKNRDDLDHSINEHCISLYSKYSPQKQHHTSNVKNSDFHIEIIKDTGFTLSCNGKRILMKDIDLFNDVKPNIKEIFDDINRDNFKKLYESIMVETGLNRESNLDDLLSNF